MKISGYGTINPTSIDTSEVRGVSGRVVIGKSDGAKNFCMRVFEIAPGGYTYKHTVGVKEYISGRINPSEGWASSFPFIAEKLVNKYPEGKTVRVLYDPARSDKSILEGAMLFPSLAFILMGVLALVVSILAVAGVMGV